MTKSPLPSLDDQRRYWDERWDRQRLPNDYQRRRGDTVLAILRSLRLTNPEILDFGCGTGWFTEELSHFARATGIDLSETAIAYAQATYPHVPFIAANLFETPFSGGQFDVVVSQEVVAHVQDPEAYLDIIARILKPGGYLIITTANRFVMERWDHGAPDPDAHIKLYPNRRAFKRMLRRRFRVLHTTSIMPIGNRGVLRFANSSKLNTALRWLIPRRYVQRLKERAGLGYTLVALAQKRPMRIGVFGHVGNQNLGDEALIAAVIQNVRRRHPEAELRGFTGRPHDTEQRHHIPAFPISRLNGRAATAPQLGLAADPPAGPWGELQARLKRVPLLPVLVRAARRGGRGLLAVLEVAFLARSYRNLRGTDLLLVAGSGQLNDYWGGPWGFPFRLFKWSLLARAAGTKVAFLSLGAGPLRTRLGKFFIKQTLRLAHYHSYRDSDSRQCITELGLPGDHLVVPDLVFSLHFGDVPRDTVRARPRMVGINPMPVFDDSYWPESDPRVYGHYIRTLAAFADWLLENGYRVRFFATQLLADHPVISQVRALMRQDVTTPRPECVVADRINSFDELVSLIDSLDIVVATRYHGTLFSLIRHKPVLSIAYHRKSMELMAQLGQAEYGIDIGRLTLETLRERFVALESHGAQFVEAVHRRLPAVREALETQYDRVFALLDCGVAAAD